MNDVDISLSMLSRCSCVCRELCVLAADAGEWYSAAELCRCSNGRRQLGSEWSAMLGSGLNCGLSTLSNLMLAYKFLSFSYAVWMPFVPAYSTCYFVVLFVAYLFDNQLFSNP